MNLASPKTLIDDVVTYMREMQEKLEEGDEEALNSLDARASALCERFNMLSEQEAHAYAPSIALLQDALGGLQMRLIERRSEIFAKLTQTGKVKNAHAAYRTSHMHDNPADRLKKDGE